MIKSEPYWWQAAPLAASDPMPLRDSSDVVIVGAGYTGLSAALTLARAGRSVQVFDRQRPGEGASSRNGGITSGNLRPSLAALTKRFGAERAAALVAESKAAREDLYRFIAEEGIDCDFKLVGRFAGASPGRRLRPPGAGGRSPARRVRHRGPPGHAERAAQLHRYDVLPWRQHPHGHRGLASGQTARRDAPPRPGRGRPRARRDRRSRHPGRGRGLRGPDRARAGPRQPRDRRHQRLHGPVRPMAAQPARTRTQSHYRDRPALGQPHGRIDAEPHDVFGDAQAPLLLPGPRPTGHASCSAAATGRSPAMRNGRPRACDARSPTSSPNSTASRSSTAGTATSP